MDYPYQILFPGEKEFPAAARLKVAVITALLDHGSFDGTDFSEAEIQAFCGDTEFSMAGGKTILVSRKPQTFFRIEPVGHLALAAKKVIQAIEKSVLANQLETVVARFNLNGEIDPVNTWLRLECMSDWFESRGISTGDLFGELWDDEGTVFLSAAEAADSIRQKLESPDVEAELQTIRADAEWDDPTNEKFMDLLRMNSALRDGGVKASLSDRPLSGRERDTLLTIIAVLCQEAKIPYEKPSKAAGMLLGTAALMGVSISETTIETHLKRARSALESRMK